MTENPASPQLHFEVFGIVCVISHNNGEFCPFMDAYRLFVYNDYRYKCRGF